MKPTILSKKELFPDKLPNNLLNRIKQTIEFIDNPIQFPACDCGENNPMKLAINPEIVSIDKMDFDRDEFSGKWATIFCFEVLEHLYNPLFFLEGIKNSLIPSGVLYLSTPRQFPQILKAKHHFHEIPTDRLMWLFKESGFSILNQDKITIAGNWYEHMHGIRPILRYFQKTRIFKLRSNF